jgi:hypothetical protein
VRETAIGIARRRTHGVLAHRKPTIEKMIPLQCVPGFASLGPVELEELAPSSTNTVYAVHQPLYLVVGPGAEVFVVLIVQVAVVEGTTLDSLLSMEATGSFNGERPYSRPHRALLRVRCQNRGKHSGRTTSRQAGTGVSATPETPAAATPVGLDGRQLVESPLTFDVNSGYPPKAECACKPTCVGAVQASALRWARRGCRGSSTDARDGVQTCQRVLKRAQALLHLGVELLDELVQAIEMSQLAGEQEALV